MTCLEIFIVCGLIGSYLLAHLIDKALNKEKWKAKEYHIDVLFVTVRGLYLMDFTTKHQEIGIPLQQHQNHADRVVGQVWFGAKR